MHWFAENWFWIQCKTVDTKPFKQKFILKTQEGRVSRYLSSLFYHHNEVSVSVSISRDPKSKSRSRSRLGCTPISLHGLDFHESGLKIPLVQWRSILESARLVQVLEQVAPMVPQCDEVARFKTGMPVLNGRLGKIARFLPVFFCDFARFFVLFWTLNVIC